MLDMIIAIATGFVKWALNQTDFHGTYYLWIINQ